MMTDNCVNNFAAYQKYFSSNHRTFSDEDYLCIFADFSFAPFYTHIFIQLSFSFTYDIHFIVLLTLNDKPSISSNDLMFEIFNEFFKSIFFPFNVKSSIVIVKYSG